MNKSTLFSIAMVLCCTAAAAQPTGLKSAPRSPAAASAAVPSAVPAAEAGRQAPSSPVVRATEDSLVPGDLRPEKRVVPQMVLPLRREPEAKTLARSPGAASGTNIDDAAARRAANRTTSTKK